MRTSLQKETDNAMIVVVLSTVALVVSLAALLTL